MRGDLAAGVLILTACLGGCGGDDVVSAPTSVPATSGAGAGAYGPSAALGSYELTFVADGACTALPPHVRSRTYTATLSPASPTVVLSGARFAPAAAPYPYWNVLYARLEGESADIWFQDPPLWESLADETYLVIFGDAHGRMAADRSTLPFWGRFEYCSRRKPDGYPECEVPAVTCESPSHQLILQRK